MNEYRITQYKGETCVSDEEYFTNRNQAIREAKHYLKTRDIDSVDLQVIYNYQDPDSELSHAWWSITSNGVKKMQDDL